MEITEINGVFNISIHAPTWGATTSGGSTRRRPRISIHAPTWGATGRLTSFSLLSLFQSTHPRGVRQNVTKMIGRFVYFNPRTHVGCDRPMTISASYYYNFNPRTHVGCDFFWSLYDLRSLRFQSTHPRGVRRLSPFHFQLTDSNFNPRTHVGCDC